ncbi:hypothetical protein [Nocardia nova]
MTTSTTPTGAAYLGHDAGADIAELAVTALRLVRTALVDPDPCELAALAAAVKHDAWRLSLRCTDAETLDRAAVAAVLTATLPADVLVALDTEDGTR